MLSESTKREIYKQCNSFFKDYDLMRMIDSLEQAVDVEIENEQLEGLNKNMAYAINRIYGNETRLMEEDFKIVSEYLFSFENFIKKILFIVSEQDYVALKKEGKLTCGYILDKLRLVEGAKDSSGRINFTVREAYKNSQTYLYYILQAYNLRNSTTHEARECTWVQLFTNLENVMVANLYICWKFHKQIESLYDTNEVSQIIDAYEYCNQIVSRYELKRKNGFEFVPVIWNKGNVDDGLSMDNIDALLRKRKHIMLRGDAGCGKTTSVEYLEYRDAKRYLEDSGSAIPILIRLAEYTDVEFDMEGCICEKLNVSVRDAQTLLEKKVLNIYLDGINEIIVSTEQKSDVVIKIENFMRKNKDLQMVVTDRKNVEIELEMSIMTLFLKKMQRKDIEMYVSKKISDSETVDKIVHYFEQTGFEEINATPLILEFLMETCLKSNGLPENSAQFYLAYIKHLLNREYVQKKDLAAAPGRLDILLLYLSLKMPEEGLSMIQVLKNFSQCRSKLGIEKIDNVHCMKLAVQLGILENEDGNYKFANENYAECLFAEALGKGLDEIDD